MDNLKRFLHPLCGRGTIQQKCGSHWRNIYWNSRGIMGICLHANTCTGRWSSSQHRFSLNLWYSCCKMSHCVKISHHVSSCLLLTAPFFHIFSSFSSSRRFPGCCTANSHRISKGHCVSLIPLQCHRAACAPLLFGSWHCRNPWVW